MDITFKRDSTAHQIVLSSIGDQYKKIDSMKPVTIQNDDWTMDIELKVNGVVLDFENFVKRLDEDYQRNVDRDAKEMVDEKFGDVFELLENFQKSMENQISKVENY